jgi:hypothetical protein
VEVAIDSVEDDVDFASTLRRVVDAPQAAVKRRPRALPMLATTIGSFGR